jgi:multidrug efflux pump subunit AcrA (membrane-fusion protein)
MKAYLSSTGTLSPEEQMLIRAEIGGRITFTRNWNEGDEVQAGQLIATIDNEEVRYLKEEATKNLQLAQERLPSSLERKRIWRSEIWPLKNASTRKESFAAGLRSSRPSADGCRNHL